ncbi:MAG: Gfo/Idh/MocA family oxidoreductase [Candidatus Brocadiales bacterium]|nr:Gfo/Idh/MocA family oxidoreductase [Candidatus Brocadiales bacterium]
MKSVRYGIVGFGGIAENRIAKEGFGLDTRRFSKNMDAMLVAACDANASRADAARALGLEWYADFSSMLADPSLDAVVIASNNRTHTSLAREAILAGKHVLIEKPIGVQLDEVCEMLDLAKARNLSVAVDHMMTKNTYNKEGRRRIREKVIGDIVHLVLHMEFAYGMIESEAATWRCADPGELGGPIGDVGSHCLYMAEFLTDDMIESLQCVYTPKHLNIAVEDGAVINFTTKKGYTGTIRVAFDQPQGTDRDTLSGLGYEVYGTKGALIGEATLFQLSGYSDEPAPVRLYTKIDGKVDDFIPQSVENIYRSQINEHAASIREGKPLRGKDGLRNLEMILQAHESAVTNQRK